MATTITPPDRERVKLARSAGLTAAQRAWAVVALPGLVALALSLLFWQGMRGSDDLGYAQLAMSALHGGDPFYRLFYAQDFHFGRIGAIAPLAVVFSVFGPSELSMALLPLLSTALTAAVVAWLGRRFWGNAHGLAAGLVYGSIPVTIGLATTFVPEPLATLEMSMAAVLVVIAVDRKRQAGLLEFIAGVVVGIAYLTTEAGALMLPVLLLYLWLGGKGSRRDIWLVAGFLAVLGGEIVFNGMIHGNPFYRFALGQGYDADSLVRAANSDLTYRLLKAYPRLLLYPGLRYAVWGPLLVIGGVWGLIRWRSASLFVIWAGAILLFYNFMSPSLRHYIVTPVASRHIAPASVPLALLAGKLLVDVWNGVSALGRGRLSRAILALYAAGMIGVAGCALLAMNLETVPTYTQAVAWNARSAARFLRTESSVTVVSDERTVRDIQFYRKYNRADSLIRFEALGPGRAATLAGGRRSPVYMIDNGPVLNQRQITGGVYGGGLSIGEAGRSTQRLLSTQAGAQVFTGHFETRPYWARLLGQPIARALMDGYTYNLDRMLLAGNPELREIRVFRLHAGSDAGPRQGANP